MIRCRLFFAALVIAVAAIAASPVRARAQEAAPAAHPAGAEASQEAAESGADSWKPVIAKAVNFALLVGILGYFLRAPLMVYLDGRIAKVREDLVTAAQTRETAVRALAEIDAKLQALPGEIETLKRRGAEDLIAERARIEQDAQADRQRMLEQTRREIEMRLSVARRELLELAADLAVNVASERIRTTITADDQARLVDRYVAQLQQGVRQ